MPNYYQYEFTSPESIFATVKEELKSHFDTGSIDDLLFPKWTDDCLKKLGRSSYPLKPSLLFLDDFKSSLPEDFFAVREAWLCLSASAEMNAPNSVYWVEKETVNKMEDVDGVVIEGSSDVPDQINVVMKKSRTLIAEFSKQYLLRPGNISVKANCSLDCRNFGSIVPDSFDIRDKQFITNFRTGTVYMVYYSSAFDDCGNQMIPDNFRIKDYIEKYITYKIWKSLADNTTDEGSFQRFERKAAEAKQMADECLIHASTEIKKETIYQKADRLAKQNQRFNRYNIR